MAFSESALWPLFSLLLLISLSGVHMVRNYRLPGLLSIFAILVSSVNVLFLFFLLGSKLSLVGSTALISGIFYAYFLSYHLLLSIRKLLSLDFFDRDNLSLIFKRNFLYASNLTFPLFIFSAFLSFGAPLYLREFGVLFSISLLVFFLFSALISPAMVLAYVRNNFRWVTHIYATRLAPTETIFDLMGSRINIRGGTRILLLSLLVIALSIILFLGLGSNSFPLFRENNLLTMNLSTGNLKEGKNVENVREALGLSQLIEKLPGRDVVQLGNDSYLISGSGDVLSILKTDLENNLKEGGYTLQQTSAFNHGVYMASLLKVVSLSWMPIAFFLFLKFGLRQVFAFVLNNALSLALIMALFIIFRVNVHSNILIAMVSYFSLSIMYHVNWFVAEQRAHEPAYGQSFSSNLMLPIRNMFLIFMFSMLFSRSEKVISLGLYIFSMFLCIHIFSSYFYIYSIRVWNLIIARLNTLRARDVKSSYQEEYDEEVVVGING